MKRYLTEADFREASSEALEMAKAWAEGDEFQAYTIATLVRAEACRTKDDTDEGILLRDLYQRLDTVGRCIAMKIYPREKNLDLLLDMMERYAKGFTYLALAHGGEGTAEKLAEHFRSVRYTTTDGGEHRFGTGLDFFCDAEALVKLGTLSYRRQNEDEDEE